MPPGGVTDDGVLQVAVGPAGVHSDGAETFRLLAEVAARHGLRRRTQANEQVDVVIARERYGRRPLELLDEWGWLAPDVTLAHLCDVTDAEVATLAAAGVTRHPRAGLRPADGLGRRADGGAVRRRRPGRAGHQRRGLATTPGTCWPTPGWRCRWRRWPAGRSRAREVLTWATRGSADGLGRADLGRLTAGARADLVCWDVTGVADAGVADPVAGLLWASPGRRPRHVVVGGRVVVRRRRPAVSADEAAVAARLRRVLAERTGR